MQLFSGKNVAFLNETKKMELDDGGNICLNGIGDGKHPIPNGTSRGVYDCLRDKLYLVGPLTLFSFDFGTEKWTIFGGKFFKDQEEWGQVVFINDDHIFCIFTNIFFTSCSRFAYDDHITDELHKSEPNTKAIINWRKSPSLDFEHSSFREASVVFISSCAKNLVNRWIIVGGQQVEIDSAGFVKELLITKRNKSGNFDCKDGCNCDYKCEINYIKSKNSLVNLLLQFNKSCQDSDLLAGFQSSLNGNSNTKLFGHSTVFYPPENSLFVYGGCSSLYSNILLQFSLDSQNWSVVVHSSPPPMKPRYRQGSLLYGNYMVIVGGSSERFRRARNVGANQFVLEEFPLYQFNLQTKEWENPFESCNENEEKEGKELKKGAKKSRIVPKGMEKQQEEVDKIFSQHYLSQPIVFFRPATLGDSPRFISFGGYTFHQSSLFFYIKLKPQQDPTLLSFCRKWLL